MSISFPTQGHHVVYMCPDIIFQILPPCSRPMMSHHVTCHMTAVSHASLSSKRKIKIVSVQVSHNNIDNLTPFFSSHLSLAQRTLVTSVVILMALCTPFSTDSSQTPILRLSLFSTMDISCLSLVQILL